jgi:hypothetical protein
VDIGGGEAIGGDKVDIGRGAVDTGGGKVDEGGSDLNVFFSIKMKSNKVIVNLT